MSDIGERAAASAISKIGVSIVEKLASKAAQKIKDQFTQIDLWSEYERKYAERYGKVKLTLTAMREAVPLEQIYTGVRFLDGLSVGQFASIEALEKGFREKPRRFQEQNCRPQDGMTVANEHPFLMVLGGPGAGKSTYLRRVGLEALKGNQSQFQHERIPVMLELKQFDGDKVDLPKAIAAEFSHAGFDFSAEFVEEALKQGRFLVLLDGLDEVPKANQDKVSQAIENFVSRYSKTDQGNRVISSCRIAAFYGQFTHFTAMELADFDDEQIRQFIDNWFYSALDRATNTAKKCWTLLNDDSYKAAKELAQTPLLLTFLCTVYDRTQSFPANRAALYRKALDILLEEWAAEKRVRHEPIYEGLNTELEKVLLAEIAYQGFREDRLFFEQGELIKHIHTFLEDSADKPKYLDGKAVLTAIVVQQGILTERAEDIYSFSHLTIQEYLTAQYLSQHTAALAIVLVQHLTAYRWREVWLLVPGLLPKADDLLKQMAELAVQHLESENLQALMSWANQVTLNSLYSAPPPAKRSVAIFFFLSLASALTSARDLVLTSALARALVLTSTLTSTLVLTSTLASALVLTSTSTSARDLVLTSDLAQIFNPSVDLSALIQKVEDLKLYVSNQDASVQEPQAFADSLSQIWCDGLGLDHSLLNLSEAEWQALSEYFYCCELIVRCKESAVRVSRNVWEAIEAAMVMPTSDLERDN